MHLRYLPNTSKICEELDHPWSMLSRGFFTRQLGAPVRSVELLWVLWNTSPKVSAQETVLCLLDMVLQLWDYPVAPKLSPFHQPSLLLQCCSSYVGPALSMVCPHPFIWRVSGISLSPSFLEDVIQVLFFSFLFCHPIQSVLTLGALWNHWTPLTNMPPPRPPRTNKSYLIIVTLFNYPRLAISPHFCAKYHDK